MARTKRTKRVEDEPDERIILPSNSLKKRTAEDDIDGRVIKIRKFKSDTLITIDEAHYNIYPTSLPSMTASLKSSNEAPTYLHLPLELRQQILYETINYDVVRFKESCRIDQITEYEWYGLQWTLLEAKKVCLQMESIFRTVHPRVEQDFKGVIEMFERDIKWMAEVLVKLEREMGIMAGPGWYAKSSEWRCWM